MNDITIPARPVYANDVLWHEVEFLMHRCIQDHRDHQDTKWVRQTIRLRKPPMSKPFASCRKNGGMWFWKLGRLGGSVYIKRT